MAQIEVDREFLHRLARKYVELEVDNRAYRALAGRAGLQNPGIGLKYSGLLADETVQQQTGFDGLLHILADSLAAEDDAAFLRTLYSLLGPE